MLLALLAALAYFYFNWQYFSLNRLLNGRSALRLWFVLFSFTVNFTFFYLCSFFELPLVINWFLIAFLFYWETLLYVRSEKHRSWFGTLLGILCGLAGNIFCRSLSAILLNQPLQNFDNHVSRDTNMKGIPVFLGFLLGGLALQLLKSRKILKRLQLILEYPRQQKFLIEMMNGLFFYLFLNLLLYTAPLNNLLLKIWSIKSCLFCTIGFYIASWYTKRICVLENYRKRNRQMEEELKKSRQEEEFLRRQALLDGMTGLYNRQYAEELIASMMDQKVPFSLCFLDLDGLKKVNDSYGHDAGDQYILSATSQIRRSCRESDYLFRYGGDEFLILFVGMKAEAVTKRMEEILKELDSISFSFGVSESQECSGWKELLKMADERMYLQKQKKQITRK